MENIKFPDKEIPCLNFIGGQFKEGKGGDTFVTSPLNGENISSFKEANSSDLKETLAMAQKGFETWSSFPLKERAQVMIRFREELLKNRDLISRTICLENGKIESEALASLDKGIEVLEFAIGIPQMDLGGKMEVSRGVSCEYRRRSLGIVGSITPFNFPAMVPMWTLPIALMVGNAFILKPSEKTPLTPQIIGRALKEAGLPDGAFSILNGGPNLVDALIESEKIKALSFVGSTPIAKLVYQKASQTGKRVLALGGAKNHIILLPDANPELAGPGISDSFTGCCGQRCMAASVLVAVGDVENHIQKIVERASSLKLGSEIGAIITGEHLKFLHESIEKAVSEGGKLLLDGRGVTPPPELKGGHWIGPTIIDQLPPTSEAAKRELFGPILTIVRADTISDAIKIENENPYGNAASVFTSSGPLAERVTQEAKAGMVGINIGVPVPREPFSFGGIHDSKFGHGDITGLSSLDFWSDRKKITTKWNPQQDSNWMS